MHSWSLVQFFPLCGSLGRIKCWKCAWLQTKKKELKFLIDTTALCFEVNQTRHEQLQSK